MASATLSFSYADRTVWIDGLHEWPHPANHDLCGPHADRTTPPRGWDRRDRRVPDAPAGPGLRRTG